MIPAMVVPVLNRPDLLHRNLASIDYPVANLVIIDNGHVVPGGRIVENVQRTHVVTMPSNLGVAGSWNLGIKSLPFAPWWLIVNSDAYFPPGSLRQFAEVARTDALVLSLAAPRWAAFALGEEVVHRVGLFDEALHPAYFEDDDYLRRMNGAHLEIVNSDVPVHHDNSSTIGSSAEFRARNDYTFSANYSYFSDKKVRGDYSQGGWSLSRRRALSWD